MTNNTFQYLIICVLGTVLIFAYMEINRLRKKAAKQREKLVMFNLVAHHLVDLLTSVKWNADLIMSEEFGKLKISQLQIMDKVKTNIDDSARLVSKFVISTGDTREKSLDANAKHAVEKMLDDSNTSKKD